ncbi:isoleucine--tRNA ligase [Methanoplanus sp. FWC-SCC4]|uniref:Isoleucine--tRNA ligase n=1 Tax=Methanochimaera problematica TaxID=2609417 RepID=A0AA97I3S6_9EURY|nr:isoleucine--tRNA ligase [Methanoplanus sp. FWC-SCC4]WOF15556.1 isoleucine--tRNA ligase [Methanoplanus sp. FWC-SCC4]
MKEVTSSYNAKEVEVEVSRYWAENDTYKKVKELKSGGDDYFFVDGPPYTTGHIHLGTAWNKILKDTILRYKRMQGFNVTDRAGYDMHGLPIEVRVENELGFESKKDIEKFGISNFIEKCKNFAITHKEIMSDQFRELGIWMDFDNPYETIKPEYIEAAWWALKKADEKKLLERGSRVVNWCPRCETAIADSEVEYWDEEDPSIYVKFPVRGKENEYLVIWTTTPWTLPANVAVAAGKDFVYARIEAIKEGRKEILWMAKDLAKEVLKKGRYEDFTILETKTGEELAGTEYDSPLLKYVPMQGDVEHHVVLADHVLMDNTGLVHTAPGHGWDDYLVGLRDGLDILCPVDGTGRFTKDAGEFEGLYVRDANHKVIEALGDHLLREMKIVHRYGHCWRCKTPIINRATEQWFIAIPKIKEQMLDEIEKVNWYPEWAGSARFHDFVADARDWCISRQRYWGIPIPVWKCDTCKNYHVFGTVAELNDAAGSDLTDPHRPYVDDVTYKCECGGNMKRVEDIFDVWFDSAMASWATIGYPRRTEEFEKLWPADFITEGQDQTRGWFYSQLGASTIAFDRAPYKNVMMHGFALDSEGRKMSKSIGNVVTPEEVIEKVGIDVLRLYVLSASAPWDDLKFNWEGVKTTNRAANILWNVYRFPLPYMILDSFEPATGENGVWNGEYIKENLPSMPDEDRWIISRVNTLGKEVTGFVQTCELHRATRAVIHCILEDISRWYVQLVRARMWLEEDAVEKRQAYETMYYVVRRLVSIMAPFTPHISENIYKNLRKEQDPESVHMCDWFSGDDSLINVALEEEMAVIRSFDESVATARQEGKRKLRWPVSEVIVLTDSDTVENAVKRLYDLSLQRANARKVTVVRGAWDKMGVSAEANMRAIGPEFGKEGPKVKAAIESTDASALKAEISSNGSAVVSGYTITDAHVNFSEVMPEGIFSAEMADATVCVDVTLNEDLEAEGYSREVIRRIQEMRKQSNLNVEDSINAGVSVSDERIAGLLTAWKDLIAGEVRAGELSLQEEKAADAELSEDWDVEGISVKIGISKA